jgi:cytochrome b561
VTPEGHFYTPHTYIGLLVTALFLGRLVYRYFGVLTTPPPVPAGANANPLAVYQNSPWTAAIFGVLVAYYILYYLGILLKSRSLSQPA